MCFKNKNDNQLQSAIRCGKQLAFFSGGNLLAQIIMMIYAILVARTLGPTKLGVYSGLYAIFSVTVTFVNFGMDIWMLSDAYKYKSIRLLNGYVVQGKLLLGLILAFASLSFLPMTQPDTFTHLYVFLVFCDVMGETIQKTFINTLIINNEIKKINFLLLLSRVGKLSLLLFLILINQISLYNIFLTRAIVTIIMLVIGAFETRPIFKMVPRRKIIKVFNKISTFGVSEILSMIYGNIDVALLSLFSVGDAGLYSPANSIIHAINIIPNSLLQFLLPRHHIKNINSKEELKNIIKKNLMGFALIGLILSFSMLVFSKPIIYLLLGAQFISTTALLMILSPILFFKSLSFGFVFVIILSNLQNKRLLPQGFVIMLNIFLNVFLIPYYGVKAVAWIYLASEVLLTLGYGFIIFKNIKFMKN